MTKSKFVAIFYSLTPNEKVSFRKWIASPFFNKKKSIIRLLDHFYSIDLKKDRHLLHRTSIHNAVLDSQPFNMAKLRHLMSELTQLLEQFLVHQYRQSQTLQFQLDLSNIYKQRRLMHLSQQSMNKVYQLHKKQPFRDINQLEMSYQIELAAYHIHLEKDRSTPQNFQTLNNNFDASYIAGKLKHSCRVLSHQGMYTQQYDTGLLTQVLSYLEEQPQYLEEPTIGLYYYYYMASTDALNETTYFRKFKNYLLRYQYLFEREEMRDLYILATNYSIKRLNTNQRSYYLTESFELYQQALENEILLENKKISPFAFTNIVAIALGLKKYDWAWDFLQTYNTYLAKPIRQAYTDYNLSRLYFQQKQYQKAAELLVADDFEDLHLNLSAKMLLLKIYYELGEFQLLEALLNRFNTYLSRQKILVYHKKNYNNIIRFTRRLVGINPFSSKAKNKLQKEIELVDLLTEKGWLLEQLKKL
ncbi:hypothetical protein [Aureispira anguillae]|uniref:Uncharacterized protein n=1 Tax=Aureispira anguillae TaxID=2864201 RepID=A0A915YL22_9BACT|nr:hypothetical protein [Aureispira anguillae]BDS14911.1 hypothetical protein AsAng_0056930 [Aureispira anguillae]